jgi:HK97 family phage portal protein
VLHLRGLTLDGIRGIGVIAHARQALGLALQAEEAAARSFSQGVIAGLVFTKPGTLSQEAFDRLKEQLETENAGAENARKALILEDDLKVDGSLMTAEDLQFLEGRQFARSDIGMFFGVPPHMYGDTEKSTSWGSGHRGPADRLRHLHGQRLVRDVGGGAAARDCLTEAEVAAGYYVRLQRQALLRGDTKTRCDAYTRRPAVGRLSPDEVRGLEDRTPAPTARAASLRPAAEHRRRRAPRQAPPKPPGDPAACPNAPRAAPLAAGSAPTPAPAPAPCRCRRARTSAP